jgi:hypothetical protein
VLADRVEQHRTTIQIVDGEVLTATDRAAGRLRITVENRLRDEIARLRLEQPGRIPVRWSPSGRPVQPPAWALGTEERLPDGEVEEVPEFLRSLPRRQLVVLGSPGAGKSVLALLVAWNLVKTWQPDDPVPVLVPLSSWRPPVRLREWMIERVRELGPGPGPRRSDRGTPGTDQVRALFDENRVMPVLDGLDELPPPLHAAAVEAIDAAVADGVPLLVTCRGDEYQQVVEESGQYLTRAAVVELHPVEPEDAIGYLGQSTVAGDTRWDGIHEALRGRPDAALTTALSSPLLLHLARTAYQARTTDPAELLDETRFATPEEIESHLLKRYVPAVFTPFSSPRLGADRAKRYLTTIARQMGRDGTREFAWWQIHSPVTTLVVGLTFGLAYGWFVTLLFGGWPGSLAGGVTGFAGFAVHLRVRDKLRQVHVTEDVRRGPRGVLRQYALLALASALLVGALMGAAVGGWLSTVLEAPQESVLDFSLLVGGAAAAAALVGSAWGSYLVSRTWLCLTRRLPWRFWAFLDTAHGLGVLRQTGAVHQFRHLRLQEELSRAARPSKRSVYSTRRATARRWKFLFPVLPSATQTLVALVWLLITGALSATNGISEPLSYQSGDRPQREPVFCDGYCGNSETWTWSLPQGATRRTVTVPIGAGGTAVAQWSGTVQANGCRGATVEVTLRLGDHPPVSFVMPNGASWDPMDDRAALAEPLHLAGKPITLTLRRTDDEPCEARFAWSDPAVRGDGMEPVRRRFGID